MVYQQSQSTTKRKTPESKLEEVLSGLLSILGSSKEEATIIPHPHYFTLTYSAMFNPLHQGSNKLHTAKGIEELFYEKFAPFLYTKDHTIRSVVSAHKCTQNEKKALHQMPSHEVYQLTMLLHLNKKYETTTKKIFDESQDGKKKITATWYGFD